MLPSVVVDDVLNAASDVLDITGGDSANGDTAVLGHVDGVLLDHSFGLLDGKTGEGEHTNLSSDVRPVALDSLLFEGGTESATHIVHSLADNNELIEPLLAHLGVVKDGTCNSCAVLRGRRVVGSNANLDLGKDLSGRGLVGADEVESSGTLTVESHDLGERLSNDHLEALVEEKTETVSVLIEGAGGETLVGGIEEGVELSGLADISDLLPLGLSRVNTGGVMGAGVEKNAGSWGGVVQVSEHAVDIETLGLFVEVSVFAD